MKFSFKKIRYTAAEPRARTQKLGDFNIFQFVFARTLSIYERINESALVNQFV